MKESPIWNRNERERSIHGETSHIAFNKFHALAHIWREHLQLAASDHQHVVRGIEPDDFDSSLGRRNENPTCATAQLENWRSGAPSLFDVESDIPFDAGRDVIVEEGALTSVFRAPKPHPFKTLRPCRDR